MIDERLVFGFVEQVNAELAKNVWDFILSSENPKLRYISLDILESDYSDLKQQVLAEDEVNMFIVQSLILLKLDGAHQRHMAKLES